MTADPIAYPPCNSWTTDQAIGAVCGPLEGSAATALDPYRIEAEQLLYELSGRQFNGVCETTIRPGRRGCSLGLAALTGGILSPGAYPEGGALGLQWGGYGWINDSGGACECGSLQQIELAGYPVVEVTEVKIDGTVVDTSTYRVDERRLLVRLRNTAAPDQVVGWPSCQIIDLPDTEPGTWSVTYTYGALPPRAGVEAAKQLACELYRASTGGPCTIPAGASRINRAGVQIDRVLLSWLKGGSTGLVHVDAFLAAYNPTRARRRPAVISPDLPRFGRHTGS